MSVTPVLSRLPASIRTATLLAAGFAAPFAVSLPVLAASAQPSEAGEQVSKEAVAAHYKELGLAIYSDALTAAKSLQSATQALVDQPTEDSMAAAKEAWKAARVPYQQSEVFRFGNPVVDDWEGRVNAWPLDEGLIDYVDSDYGTSSDGNPFYTANVIANPQLTTGTSTIDASQITPELLKDKLQEVAGNEANVATGYHAIEFLLWGQDLNGTSAGSGERKFTDYSTNNCTNDNCDRRGDYLMAASKLLVSDLEEMVVNWKPGGAVVKALDARGPDGTLSSMLTGMGSLSYGELAGERIQLGLMLHDPEEEHDCFSDNTHWSHYYDAQGVQNMFSGSYERLDGSKLEGASLKDLLEMQEPALAKKLGAALEKTMTAMQAMADRAKNTEAYDQMIGAGNTEGNTVVQGTVDGLINQTRFIEKTVAALELGQIEIEGSESLDQPTAVFE